MDSKELVMCTLAKNKHKKMIGGQKKTVFGSPRIKKARKALRRVRTTSLRMMSVPIIQRNLQVMSTTGTKEEARIRKEKVKKVPILNLDFQPRKHP